MLYGRSSLRVSSFKGFLLCSAVFAGCISPDAAFAAEAADEEIKDLNKLTATLNKGLLTLHIPTAEGQLARKIEIQNSDKPKLENKKK